MESKLFRIQYQGYSIPVLATQIFKEDMLELTIPHKIYIVTDLINFMTKSHPLHWNDNILRFGHDHIKTFWSELKSGQIINIERGYH